MLPVEMEAGTHRWLQSSNCLIGRHERARACMRGWLGAVCVTDWESAALI